MNAMPCEPQGIVLLVTRDFDWGEHYEASMNATGLLTARYLIQSPMHVVAVQIGRRVIRLFTTHSTSQ